MKVLGSILAGIALVAVSSSMAMAGNMRGHISATVGGYDVNSTDDGTAEYNFGRIEASFGTKLMGAINMDLDLFYEGYDWESVDHTHEQPEATFIVAGNMAMMTANDVYWGPFVAYGYSTLHDEDNYSMWMAGMGAQRMLGVAHVFIQLGYGDNTGNDGEAEGFNSGWIARGGMNFFLSDHTSFGFEGTLANAQPYIDGNDDGEFYGVTVQAETRIFQTPLYGSVFYSYNHYDATTENDTMSERILGISLSYRFNGASARSAARNGASLGVPTLPVYANGRAEQID